MTCGVFNADVVIPEELARKATEENVRQHVEDELGAALTQEAYEYRYERKLIYQTNEWQPIAEAKWYPTPELAESAASRAPNAPPVRLTRRRVSQPEVME